MTDTAIEDKVPQTEVGEAEAEAGGEERGSGVTEREVSPPVAPVGSGRDRKPGERQGPGTAEARGEGGRPNQPIEYLSNIELEAAVELGRATLLIGDVLKLAPGSLVQLDKMLGEPAELVIRGTMIARGEVVVVDDRFGLRITEVLSRGRS